jgi:hypothetical protein
MEYGDNIFTIGSNNYTCSWSKKENFFLIKIKGSEGYFLSNVFHINYGIKFRNMNFYYCIPACNYYYEGEKEELLQDLKLIEEVDLTLEDDHYITFLSSSREEYISPNSGWDVKPVKRE